MKPSRILYVITDLRTGGVPLHLLRLACAVRDAGHDITVVTLAPPAEVADLMISQGIAVASCQAAGRWDVRVLARLRRHLRRFSPDLVHTLLFHANLACRLSTLWTDLLPARLLCEIQTVEQQRRWHLTLDRWTFRLCRAEIANSPAVLEHLRERARLPQEKLRLVSGGVNLDRFATAAALPRQALGARDDELLVLWAGRLDPAKGLEDLLEATARIAPRHALRVLLAGEGPLRDSLGQRIAALGLEARVTLLGLRTDIPALLKTCDLFVFPSHTEGLPNALLEAMAAGCAIVCTDIPPHAHLIEHEHSGLLVPPAQPERLAEAMVRMRSAPGLRTALGRRAQDTAAQRFSESEMVNRYLALYAEVLTSEHRSGH